MSGPLMVILLVVLAIVGLCGVIVYQRFRITGMKEGLYKATRESQRARRQQQQLRKALARTEEQFTQSIANTSEALTIAKAIQTVSAQLHALTEYAGVQVDAVPGRHAVHHAIEPAEPIAVNYELPSQPTMSNGGSVHYVGEG
jgi:cytoskeletal protein RodZ